MSLGSPSKLTIKIILINVAILAIINQDNFRLAADKNHLLKYCLFIPWSESIGKCSWRIKTINQGAICIQVSLCLWPHEIYMQIRLRGLFHVIGFVLQYQNTILYPFLPVEYTSYIAHPYIPLKKQHLWYKSDFWDHLCSCCGLK